MNKEQTILINTIEELDRKVTTNLQKRLKANRIAMIGGLAFLIFVIAYLQVFHSLAVDVFSPKTLIPYIRGEVEQFIPHAVAGMQVSLKEAAPGLAKTTRQRAMNAIPEVRKAMEQQFMAASEPYVKDLERELDVLIQQGINEKRESFAAFVKDPDNPATREEFTKVVKGSLQSIFDDPTVKADLDSYAMVLERFDVRFKRLRDGDKLTPAEETERKLILCMRELSRRKHDAVDALPALKNVEKPASQDTIKAKAPKETSPAKGKAKDAKPAAKQAPKAKDAKK